MSSTVISLYFDEFFIYLLINEGLIDFRAGSDYPTITIFSLQYAQSTRRYILRHTLLPGVERPKQAASRTWDSGGYPYCFY